VLYRTKKGSQHVVLCGRTLMEDEPHPAIRVRKNSRDRDATRQMGW
jgi:hypothetical protein